ncbi:unnamed protein product [Urochloa humidicola]
MAAASLRVPRSTAAGSISDSVIWIPATVTLPSSPHGARPPSPPSPAMVNPIPAAVPKMNFSSSIQVFGSQFVPSDIDY